MHDIHENTLYQALEDLAIAWAFAGSVQVPSKMVCDKIVYMYMLSLMMLTMCEHQDYSIINFIGPVCAYQHSYYTE